ncbi:MAG: hypothetical protein ACI9OJ_001691 [Myxococcota bacterium]|jgi:hypothetical protein
MHSLVELPTSLDLRDLSGDGLTRLFRTHNRFSYELMYRSAIFHLHRRVEDGLEEPPRRNIRGLFYSYGRPLAVASGESHRRPYLAFLHAMRDLTRTGRLSMVDFGITDELWENRRIGGRHPGIIVIAEKVGQIRLLRQLHDTHDVTVQAFRGNPSAVTCEYLARHVRTDLERSRTRQTALLCLVDWDPYGHQIPGAVRTLLRRFDLPLPEPELLLTPSDYTSREIRLHSYRPRISRRHPKLADRWLNDTGGIDGRFLGLAIDAVPRDRLLALCTRAIQREIRAPR